MASTYFLSMANVHGGAERIGLHIANVLGGAYEGKCLLNSALKPHASFPKDRVTWIHVPDSAVKIARNPLAILYYLLVSLWFVARYRPKRGTVFYCNDLESVFMASAARLFSRGRIVWHVHDAYKLEKRSTRMVLALVASVTDMLVCLTASNAERMASIFLCHIEVIPNFCRLEPFMGARKRIFRQDGEIVFGYLGQITHWKRVDAAIRLIKALTADYGVKCRLKIGGVPLYDSDRRYKKEMLQLSGNAPYIEWLGAVNDTAEFFEGIDFLVSLSDNEPFGLAIVEALSQGVPVISSDGDGPRELLADGAGLIDTSEGNNLVENVKNYINSLDDSDYASTSSACIKKVSLLYGVDSFSDRVCGGIDRLLEQ